jgi:hypothetical protein
VTLVIEMRMTGMVRLMDLILNPSLLQVLLGVQWWLPRLPGGQVCHLKEKPSQDTPADSGGRSLFFN